MKEIVFVDNPFPVRDFDDLLKMAGEKSLAVGYSWSHDRFMLVPSGGSRGVLVNWRGTWGSIINSEDKRKVIEDGTFYVFESSSELYEWMKNK